MLKRVLDVGNCAADHGAIQALIEENFRAEVVQVHGADDALDQLRAQPFALVLINRKLDRDHSDGLVVLKQIKAQANLATVPVMLITNFVEHQQSAVQCGAEPGFGKSELDRPETLDKLSKFLAS